MFFPQVSSWLGMTEEEAAQEVGGQQEGAGAAPPKRPQL
jgi:hypothetical protein